MLLVVINDEEPQHQQAAQNAADELPRDVEVPMGARHRNREEGHGGKNMPPTFDRRIMGVFLRRGNQFRTGSWVWCQVASTVGIKSGNVEGEGRKSSGPVETSQRIPSRNDAGTSMVPERSKLTFRCGVAAGGTWTAAARCRFAGEAACCLWEGASPTAAEQAPPTPKLEQAPAVQGCGFRPMHRLSQRLRYFLKPLQVGSRDRNHCVAIDEYGRPFRRVLRVAVEPMRSSDGRRTGYRFS